MGLCTHRAHGTMEGVRGRRCVHAHLQNCIFTFCKWKRCIFTLRKWKKLDFYTSYKDLVCFYIRHIKSVQGRARASTLACCIFTASCTQGWVALVLLLVCTSIKPQLTHNWAHRTQWFADWRLHMVYHHYKRSEVRQAVLAELHNPQSYSFTTSFEWTFALCKCGNVYDCLPKMR